MEPLLSSGDSCGEGYSCRQRSGSPPYLTQCLTKSRDTTHLLLRGKSFLAVCRARLPRGTGRPERFREPRGGRGPRVLAEVGAAVCLAGGRAAESRSAAGGKGRRGRRARHGQPLSQSLRDDR